MFIFLFNKKTFICDMWDITVQQEMSLSQCFNPWQAPWELRLLLFRVVYRICTFKAFLVIKAINETAERKKFILVW